MKNLAKRVLAGFESLGLPLAPSSRLFAQANAYLDPKGVLPQVIPPEHPLFETALEGQCDLRQVGYVFHKLLPIMSNDVEFRNKAKLLRADVVLPQESQDNSPGRDAQCELLVTAICQHARLSPAFAEPDLRCSFNGVTYGLAIKRIKSRALERRFAQRMREATEQISSSGLPGIVVIDISQSLNHENYRVPRRFSDAVFDSICARDMRRLLDGFRTRMVEWSRGTPLRGLIVLCHFVREHPERGWSLDLQVAPYELSPYNQARRRQFLAFAEQFCGAARSPGTL